VNSQFFDFFKRIASFIGWGAKESRKQRSAQPGVAYVEDGAKESCTVTEEPIEDVLSFFKERGTLGACDLVGGHDGYPPDWTQIAENIRERDNHTCKGCGAREVELHVHHITHKSEGGGEDPANLVTLCRACHEDEHPGMKR